MELRLGEKQTLVIVKKVEFGVYLATKEAPEDKVLLPAKQVPEGAKVGDELEVFLYRDSSDRLISTTRTPKLCMGQVPLLLQWDKRWGYESYGDSIIGLAGCGPTCLSMVYVYFTHDLNGTPREIASYCEKNGYYTENGTSWSLWTEGLPALGLSGKELPLVENSMKTALDQGKLIVCSMRPGDFTTSGHYILLYDYDDTGFCVKDPNRVSNSSRTWDYDTLSPQIKNLWTISPTGF